MSPWAARWSSAGAFALALAILVARAWPRLVDAELWGEDGRIFTAQALQGGFESVWRPMHGSFFVLQRLVVVLSLELLPLAWMPTVVAAASLLLTAYVFSRFAHRDLAWILPDASARWGLAALLCLAPGLGEMLGNLCNTNWILFAWVSFLGLRDPRTRPSWIEMAVLVVVVQSMGTSALLVPVFGWRVAHAWWQGARGERLARESLLLGIVLLGGVVPPLLVGGPPNVRFEPVPVMETIPVWLAHLGQLAVVTPWLGDRATIALMSGYPVAYSAMVLLLGAALALAAWRAHHLRWPVLLAVWGLATSTWTILATRVRPNAFPILQSIHDERLYAGRYAFAVSFVALVWWMAATGNRTWPARARRLLVVAFVAIVTATSLHRFPADRYGVARKWVAALPALESSRRTGSPPMVKVEQYPQGWSFGYVAPGVPPDRE